MNQKEIEAIKKDYWDKREAFEIARSKFWEAADKCEHPVDSVEVFTQFQYENVAEQEIRYRCSVCEKDIAIVHVPIRGFFNR